MKTFADYVKAEKGTVKVLTPKNEWIEIWRQEGTFPAVHVANAVCLCLQRFLTDVGTGEVETAKEVSHETQSTVPGASPEA